MIYKFDYHVHFHKQCLSYKLAGDSDEGLPNRRFRTRRSTSRKYIETSVVVEPDVYKFHGKETEQFVKTVMNVVSVYTVYTYVVSVNVETAQFRTLH